MSTVTDCEESEVPAQLSDYIPPTVTMNIDKYINPHVLTGRPLIIIRGSNNNTLLEAKISPAQTKFDVKKIMLFYLLTVLQIMFFSD